MIQKESTMTQYHKENSNHAQDFTVRPQFTRTAMLLGEDGLKKLADARVALFGVGGVGGHVAEALIRSGVGALDLIDNDTVEASNINRQLVATTATIGKYKVDVMASRAKTINPDVIIRPHRLFYLPETKDRFDFHDYDYVIDAVDTVAAKLALIEEAKRCNTPIICSMGAGNKLDPTRFEVADITKTSVDPLAKVIRRECKHRGIRHLKVVYSKEKPKKVGGRTPGSTAFVPSVVGLIIAGEVVCDLTGVRPEK